MDCDNSGWHSLSYTPGLASKYLPLGELHKVYAYYVPWMFGHADKLILICARVWRSGLVMWPATFNFRVVWHENIYLISQRGFPVRARKSTGSSRNFCTESSAFGGRRAATHKSAESQMSVHSEELFNFSLYSQDVLLFVLFHCSLAHSKLGSLSWFQASTVKTASGRIWNSFYWKVHEHNHQKAEVRSSIPSMLDLSSQQVLGVEATTERSTEVETKSDISCWNDTMQQFNGNVKFSGCRVAHSKDFLMTNK